MNTGTDWGGRSPGGGDGYDFARFMDELSGARSVSVLTGAGISAESGVPTFRGKGGIWEDVAIEDVATLTALRRDPARVWAWFRDLRSTLATCGPNPAHFGLAALEDRFPDLTVITQNIDNYHQLAGSRNVVELHGNAGWDRCQSCGTRTPAREEGPKGAPSDGAVPGCPCGGPLKPDVVFFEESLDPVAVERAFAAAERSEFMLVIGTSAMVTPAASLPFFAFQTGTKVIEINLEPTGHTPIALLSMFVPATVAVGRILLHLGLVVGRTGKGCGSVQK